MSGTRYITGALAVLLVFGPLPCRALETSTLNSSAVMSTNEDEGEVITLGTAIARALRKSPSTLDQNLALRSSELFYRDAWDRMYLPTISFNLTQFGAKTLSHLPGDNTTKLGATLDEHGYSGTGVQLSLGSYTLYNFGKDQLGFEQSRLDWNRTKEAFEEFKRGLKFQTIVSFWALKTALDKLDASSRAVEIARAIEELQESRLPLGQATPNDISSSTIDLISAKNLRDQNDTNAKIALWSFATLIGDPVGTRYKIESDISFLPIKVTEQVLYDTYLRESPSMKNARKDLTRAEIAVQLENLNRLPLPKVSFSGITVGYTNGYYGNRADLYTQSSGNTNLDISAQISFSIPLMGPGGLFGSRTIEQVHIQRDQSELRLRDTANRDKSQLYQMIQNIRQSEITVANNRQSYQNSISVLEDVFQRFTSSKAVSRLDIKDAIIQARDSEIALSDSILNHLTAKTQLAGFIGVDYLPRME
jgi:outer membrane protein TolC